MQLHYQGMNKKVHLLYTSNETQVLGMTSVFSSQMNTKICLKVYLGLK
jgi:hypothetical protein